MKAIITVAVVAVLSIASVWSTPVGRQCCGCAVNPDPVPIPANPAVYGPACTATMLNTLWPDCQATRVFYQCESLTKFVHVSCAAGTVFSFERQLCVHQDSVQAVSNYCLNFGGVPVPPMIVDDENTGGASCGNIIGSDDTGDIEKDKENVVEEVVEEVVKEVAEEEALPESIEEPNHPKDDDQVVKEVAEEVIKEETIPELIEEPHHQKDDDHSIVIDITPEDIIDWIKEDHEPVYLPAVEALPLPEFIKDPVKVEETNDHQKEDEDHEMNILPVFE